MKTSDVTLLPPTTTPEELKSLADDLRFLADQVEAGEILALTWVEHRVNDKFASNWIKSRGISRLELLGGAYALLQQMSKEYFE